MRVLALITHPIQYQVPLFRELNKQEGVSLKALYLSDHSLSGGKDPGFGQSVLWDVPLLEGYEHEFIPNQGGGLGKGGFFAYRTSGLRRRFLAEQADVLFVPGHMVCAYFQGVVAARQCGMVTMSRPDSLEGTGRKRHPLKAVLRAQFLRQFYSRVDIFCYSGHFSRQDADAYSFSEDHIVCSPYNIDSGLFERQREKFLPERKKIRSELNMRETDMVVLFTGKMIDWKNPELIIEALRQIPDTVRQSIFPLFIGAGVNFDRIKENLASLLGENRFCMPGFVNQSGLGKYYSAGDVFVLPSKRGHESWGLVVNEAMIFGLPCLVSDGVGCRKDLVIEGKTGYTFPAGDASALAELLISLQGNATLRNEMSQNAYRHIQNYSTEKAVDGLLEALEIARPIRQQRQR